MKNFIKDYWLYLIFILTFIIHCKIFVKLDDKLMYIYFDIVKALVFSTGFLWIIILILISRK